MIRKHLTVGNYRMYPNKYKERNKLVRFLFEDQEFRTDAIAKLLQSEKVNLSLFISSQLLTVFNPDWLTRFHQNPYFFNDATNNTGALLLQWQECLMACVFFL